MKEFMNSTAVVSNNTTIAGNEFGDKVATAIAKAVVDGKLAEIGLTKDMEDDGKGGLQESGNFEIVDESAFADFIMKSDNTFKAKAAVVTPPANTSAAKVWLKNAVGVAELPRTTTKVTGKVLRYHISMVDGKAIGLSLTFQTVDKGVVKNDNTALISAEYLKPIIKKDPTAANMLAYADENLKDAVIVLGSRTTVADHTAYYRELSKLNELESKAYKAVNKTDVMVNDRGLIGFVHRVSNTSFTFTSLASTTEKLQFDTMVSRLSELSIKVTEKAALDGVELQTLGERNRIESETIEHHLNTAKRMLNNGVITTEQYNVRVSNLLEKYGM